jgi:hypothetical protein
VLHVLRLAVGLVGALLLAVGLLLMASGGVLVWPGIQLTVLGVLAVVIAFFERLRYQAAAANHARRRPTDEVFIDPSSGQRTRVWIDPVSGERSYLPVGEAPQK